MGKIRVHPIPGGDGDGWDKLLEEGFSLSGYTTSSSESGMDSTTIQVATNGYDILVLEIIGQITIQSGSIAYLKVGDTNCLSGAGAGKFRALLIGDGVGFFYQVNSFSMRNFGVSDRVSITLAGRQVNASATGTVRIFGKKLNL